MYINVPPFFNGVYKQLPLLLKLNKIKRKGKKVVGCGYPFFINEYKALISICDYFIDDEENLNCFFAKKFNVKSYKYFIEADLKNAVIVNFLPDRYNLLRTLNNHGISNENIIYVYNMPDELLTNNDDIIKSQKLTLYHVDISNFRVQHGINALGKCEIIITSKADFNIGYIEMYNFTKIENHSMSGVKILDLFMKENSELNIERNGKLTVDSLYMGSNVKFNIYSGEANIGHVYIGSNSTIHVYSNLSIGDECMISWNVSILDGDGHNLKYDNTDNKPEPIIINDKVWIGNNSVVLKGVEIGKGSVIGSGSVVTKSVPPNCLALGNPVKVVKENIQWEYNYDYM